MSNKAWIFIAVALLVAGLMIFVLVMSALGWDFTKLSTAKFETNTHEITEAFDGISIDTDTADIRFLPSTDGECKVVCYEREKVCHEISVEDGVLTVEVVDTREWYEHIGISFSTQTVTVYLPNSEYTELFIRSSTGCVEIPADFAFNKIDVSVSTGAVKLAASAKEGIKIGATTGSIALDGISASTLDLSASTGSITVKNSTVSGDIKTTTSTGGTRIYDTECKSLTATASTGSIYLKNTVASGRFLIEVDTGDIHFESCDAGEIYAEADTGSITGTLLTEKSFTATTDTGSVDVPRGTSGGVCELTTDTGDIRITVNP